MKNRNHTLNAILFFFILTIPGCSRSQLASEILPGAFDTKQYLSLLTGKKTGLVINHTSLIGNINLVDSLQSLGIPISAIFTPEHGFKGSTDAGALVSDSFYSNDSIPIVSLYGKNRKPSPEDLKGIEVIVFDLQDVGVRFYTYLSTLHYVMEACAEQKIPLIVLDRPNPNGFYIDGPVLEPGFTSFVGMHPVPVVYGMTIGEYARMINGEYWLTDSLQCELTIIKCQNYTHSSYYNLPVPPSPNLPGMRAVYLYPSIAFFEGTVVSEGRGTKFPFQVIGHPDFTDHSFSFIPEPLKGYSLNPKLKWKTCYGMDLRNISIDTLLNEKKINLDYLLTFYRNLDLGEKFFIHYFDLLAGNDLLRSQIIDGVSIDEICRSWDEELEAFKKIRVKYLLYPDFD